MYEHFWGKKQKVNIFFVNFLWCRIANGVKTECQNFQAWNFSKSVMIFFPSKHDWTVLMMHTIRGEIIKSPAGRPATRTGDPQLRRIFAKELSGRNYPNRTGRFLVFWKTPYQITRRQKSAQPDCRAPGSGKKSSVRAITVRHSPAAILEGKTT